MKRLTLLAVAAIFIMTMAGAASAVPRLQTYIVGSSYHDFYKQEFQSWITNSQNFDLKVVGYWNPAAGAGSSLLGATNPGYDYMDCYLMLSVPHEDCGRIWINGNELTGFGGYSASLPSGVSPSALTRLHLPTLLAGAFSFQSVGRIDNDQINAHEYSRSGIGNPGWGDEILLNVVVSGYSWAHFDAVGVDSYGRTYTNAFSSDASYYRNCAAPEPGTLSLLGLGLLGMIPILRRKKD
jgi:hypothetical protein